MNVGGGGVSISARLCRRAPRTAASQSSSQSTSGAAGERGGVDVRHTAVKRVLLGGLDEALSEQTRVGAELCHGEAGSADGV